MSTRHLTGKTVDVGWAQCMFKTFPQQTQTMNSRDRITNVERYWRKSRKQKELHCIYRESNTLYIGMRVFCHEWCAVIDCKSGRARELLPYMWMAKVLVLQYTPHNSIFIIKFLYFYIYYLFCMRQKPTVQQQSATDNEMAASYSTRWIRPWIRCQIWRRNLILHTK